MITQTRDADWLGKCYNHWRKNKSPSNDYDKDEGFNGRICDIKNKIKKELKKIKSFKKKTRRSGEKCIKSLII
jgi:hypothetical protein